MTKPRLIVTGSRGKIGRILCKHLSDEFEILEIDKEPIEIENYFQADISDFASVISVFQEIIKAEYIIHLAADVNNRANWKSVLFNNIIGTKNVYECARLFNIQKIVFASSLHACWPFEELNPAQNEDIQMEFESEQRLVRPDGDYGTSKAFGEALARQYFELFGIHSICLRIGYFCEFDTIPKYMPEYFKKILLSKEDAVRLFKKSLSAGTEFGIFTGISGGIEKTYDILDRKHEASNKPVSEAGVTR